MQLHLSDLSSVAQSLIILIFLLVFILNAYQVQLIYQIKIGKEMLISSILVQTVIGSLALLIIICYNAQYGALHLPVGWENRLPNPLVAQIGVVLGLMVFVEIVSRIFIVRWRRIHISPLSLKEAMDNLPDGICIYTKEGIPLLINRTIRNLSVEMTGTVIFNAIDFLTLLDKGVLKNGCRRIPGMSEKMVRTNDGEVWKFTIEEFSDASMQGQSIFQLIAANVTENWKMNALLQEENKKLRIMNDRLEDYRINLDESVKADELLTMRLRVHDELGQMLLTTRRFLSVDQKEITAEEKSVLFENWHNLMKLMRSEDGIRVENNPEKELLMASQSLGMELEVKGEFPQKTRLLHLLMSAARECMTNAAHAGATMFSIEIERDGTWVIITYRNNGIPPVYPLVEGGGLGSLRKLLEKEGASLKIPTKGDFYVCILIPDRRENR